MPRIRSIHPGQWTDEEFVSCSFPARLLALAIRNLSDDNGIFEWKPLGLKMRAFPADDVDIEALLGELVDSGQVCRYTAGSKPFGVIRNFHKFQSPRKPSYAHPLPEAGDVPDFADLKLIEYRTGTAPVPHQCGKVPREGVGEGVGEGEKIEKLLSSGDDAPGDVTAKKTTPDCPHKEILAAFAELLPMLRQPRDWTPARRALLAARWNESVERQSVIWWRNLFTYIANQCSFLLGTKQGVRGSFQADLPWMLKQANFLKIIEGAYDDED